MIQKKRRKATQWITGFTQDKFVSTILMYLSIETGNLINKKIDVQLKINGVDLDCIELIEYCYSIFEKMMMDEVKAKFQLLRDEKMKISDEAMNCFFKKIKKDW